MDAWSPSGGAALFLAPHSDDAAFSSAGALHACARRGMDIQIVTCCTVSAHARGGGVSGADAVTRARKEEDRRFVATLPGSVSLRWLDLPDAPLRPQHAHKHPCKEAVVTADDEALAARIEALVAEDAAAASIVMAPLGLGRHVDHLVVRDAGARLARRGARVIFWEDLPYAGRVSLAQLDEEIARALASLGLARSAALVLDGDLEAQKREALACYPSQVIDVHRDGVLGHLRRVSGTGAPAERLWV